VALAAGSQQRASNCAAGARIWRDDVNAKGGFQCPPAGRCHGDRRPRMRRHISSAVLVTFRNYVSTTLLTSGSGRARWFASLLMRGVSGDDPEGGAGEWRPAAAARNRSLGRFGKSARQALRPGCEELRCTDREAMPEMEARNPDLKSPWWSAERRASRVMGRRGASQAPRPAAGHKRVHARLVSRSGPTGCRCIRAPVGAPPTPHRGGMLQDPGRGCVAGTRCAACCAV
jgi:hypothetical protein